LEVAIKAGATTLNIPDTVGYTMPDEFGKLIAGIIANTKGIENCVVSVHCHNDLGLATANTLAGIRAGARQAEVTINGIGERAGNTALEEVVMALHARRQVMDLATNIDTTQLTRLSKLVSNYTGMSVQPNKAIVGANAFAHEAGIHQDGVLKNTLTYEIMKPETVGLSASKLVLGKHSGRHALKERLISLGYTLDEESLNKLFDRFKVLADKKKTITDADIEALISDEIYQNEVIFTLEGLQVACGTMGLPTATVRLVGPDGETHIYAAIGTGPVDATFKAIDAIVQMDSTLVDFVIHAITEGIDALGEVTVRIATKDLPAVMTAQKEIERPCTFGGYGADTDIIVASAKAYLSAINKMLASTGKYGPVETPAVQAVAG
jgi:2-isopropylmalate synthase